jgi:hypothetical protein
MVIKEPNFNDIGMLPIEADDKKSPIEPSFMGKSQVEKFSGLTDVSSVDRSGRAKASNNLDPVGIKTAMNPPFATPTDIDQQETDNLYTNKL